MASVRQPESLKQLFVDLAAFSLLKTDWHTEELAALDQAICGMRISPQAKENFARALELLRQVGSSVKE